jgi:uncharacterized membrane protein YbhN (UPF0104 family)
LAEIRKGLFELGVPVDDLSEASSQETGVFLLDATGTDGGPLRVKVYGRDAWDAQLLAKVWRALWFRGTATLALTRLQQVEHEGFLTLLATRNGVPAQDVVRAGKTADSDAIIVMRVRGTPLTREGSRVGSDVVDGAWDTVLALGAAGMAHGDLGPDAFRVDRGQVLFDSMSSASVAADRDQRCIDLAQLLTLSALLMDPDQALDMAYFRLGPEDLGGIVPYLQKAALGPHLRQAVARGHLDVDGLRGQAAAKAGIEAPKMAAIRRVSTKTLVQAGLLVVAAYFLISTLAGVDINQVIDALKSASVPVLLLALVVAQLPRFAYAESTRAACPRPLPYGPPVLLQFAVTFISLVFPGTVARMALNIRFFQRQGIPPASAVSIGVIENFGGYVVQIVIILAAVVFGFGEIHLDLQASSHRNGDLLEVLGLIIAIVVVAAVVAVAVPRWRKRVLDRARPALTDLRETLASLRSPTRVAKLLLANLAAEILFASTLGLVLLALGTSRSLATLLVVNVFVSFFASMIPVPGGIGVSEGALMVGLTAVGIDQSIAFAAAICYRLCTFYLPPIWGFFAFRRLERTGLL